LNFAWQGRHPLVRPARLRRDALNMPPRDVGGIVGDKSQSVKLIKLIILIEIDYQHKMGIKGYLYSLFIRKFGPKFATFCLEN
jgi:hypothetical protein